MPDYTVARCRRITFLSSLDLRAPRTPCARALADYAAETMAEMTRMRKSAFRRDLSERVAAHAHEMLSPLDSHANDILLGSAAKTSSERSFEFVAAELRDLGQVCQLDLCLQMDGYISLHAADLPRLHEIVALV
jgi:hypothetical protein